MAPPPPIQPHSSMPPKSSTAPTTSQDSFAYTLLRRANSPSTADDVYTIKIQNKRLALLPTASKKSSAHTNLPSLPFSQAKPTQPDARTLRQQRRQALSQARKRKARNKPKPATAKEIREKQLYALPPAKPENYTVYQGLHKLWCGYMRDALGLTDTIASGRAKEHGVYVTPAGAGPVLASADHHGAELEVVRSKCDGRVGLKGFVVRDTKFTFVLCLRGGRFVTVPKEGTVFRVEVPLEGGGEEGGQTRGGAGEDTKMTGTDVAETQTGPDNDKPEGDRTGDATATNTSASHGMGSERHDDDKTTQDEVNDKLKPLVFEIDGNAFRTRATNRTNKKFRWHPPKEP